MKQAHNKFGRMLDTMLSAVLPEKKAAAWCRNITCYRVESIRYCLQLCCTWRGCSTKTVRG